MPTTLGQMTDGVLGHAREATAAHLTATLRQHATEAGWPSHVVSGLSVGHDFKVSMHPATQSVTEDLEYGTETTPPGAVIRRFSNRLDQHVGDQFANAFHERAEVYL